MLPDYFARVDDGTGLVIDVRPDERIKALDAEAFAVTASACQMVGWRFRRVGAVASVFAANVRWLSRYRHPRCGRREDVAARLLEVFAQPTALFEGADRAGDRLVSLPVLFHLTLAAGADGGPDRCAAEPGHGGARVGGARGDRAAAAPAASG